MFGCSGVQVIGCLGVLGVFVKVFRGVYLVFRFRCLGV